MTPEEWNNQVASHYEDLVKGIAIEADITPQIIKGLISQIDEVLNEVYFDYSRAKSAYEAASNREKTFTKDYFVRFKDEGASDKLADAKATKKAEDERIYYHLNETRRRYNFMQAVIDLLETKREMLITDGGVLKLEASLKQ
jgi:hypothetical protein